MRRRVSALISILLCLESMSLGGSALALLIRRRHPYCVSASSSEAAAAAARFWTRSRSRLFSVVVQDQTASPSNNNSNNNTTLLLKVPTSQDMEDVGAVLATTWLEELATTATATAPSSFPATCLLLQGDLGAGKTAFARGFVQGALGDDNIRVTSPTYLLSNTYSVVEPAVEIHHMDLYRLTGDRSDELAPLNLDHVFSHCISLIEWPSRLFAENNNNNGTKATCGKFTLPDNCLTVDIRILMRSNSDDDEEEADTAQEDRAPRRVTLTVHGNQWTRCMEQIRQEGYLDDMIILKGKINEQLEYE